MKGQQVYTVDTYAIWSLSIPPYFSRNISSLQSKNGICAYDNLLRSRSVKEY